MIRPMTEEVDYDQLQTYLQNRPDIPEGKRGKVSVTHTIIPAGETMPVVSRRNALLMGQRPAKVQFTDDYILRSLKYEGGTWMTDHPQEIWQMHKPFHQCYGRVLVGGLGLGVFPHLLHKLGNHVSEIYVVEKDTRIINLIKPHITEELGDLFVQQGDLFKYVKEIYPGTYDSAFLDIWRPTGESVWYEYVVPLRRLLKGKIDQENVHCWNEEEMIGQLENVLPKVAELDESLLTNRSTGYYRVFREAVKRKGLRGEARIGRDNIAERTALELVAENMQDEDLKQYMELYMRGAGTDEWEKEFGDLWDKYVPRKK